MGRRGPPPKTKKQLEDCGSKLAKDRHESVELDAETPTMPTTLCGEARAEWKRLVSILAPTGVLARVDRAALTILCQSWAEYCDLQKESVRVMKASRNHVSADVRRLLSAKQDAFSRWSNLSQRFGLTPADRSRVKAGPVKKSIKDVRERFFKHEGSGFAGELAG